MTTAVDLSKIKGHEISGLAEDEIEFIQELMQKDSENPNNVFNQFTGFDVQNENDFSKFLEYLNTDDKPLSTDEIKEIENLENESKCKSTESQTKHYLKMFLSFLKENKLSDEVEAIPLRYIESYLRLWFSRLKKKDGTLYSPTTLACCRAAIHRHLLEKRNTPLIGNAQFLAFERTYKACVTKAIRARNIMTSEGGSGYPAIEPEDLVLLRQYFNRSTPVKLQDEVFFLIVYHFGFRGREWLRSLNTKSLVIKHSNGTKYVDFEKSMEEKNVRFTNQAVMRQIVMTATPSNEETCPVAAIEAYLSKLPADSPLFPKPCSNFEKNKKWYCEREVLGKNSLGDQMKKISGRAGLSHTYTNHSIRSSCVTNLRKHGFTPEQCQLVTGHSRIESVHRYDKRKASEKITLSEKNSMSRALSSSLNQNMKRGAQDLQIVTVEKNVSIQASTSKKMKITADGINNIVQITFE